MHLSDTRTVYKTLPDQGVRIRRFHLSDAKTAHRIPSDEDLNIRRSASQPPRSATRTRTETGHLTTQVSRHSAKAPSLIHRSRRRNVPVSVRREAVGRVWTGLHHGGDAANCFLPVGIIVPLQVDRIFGHPFMAGPVP